MADFLSRALFSILGNAEVPLLRGGSSPVPSTRSELAKSYVSWSQTHHKIFILRLYTPVAMRLHHADSHVQELVDGELGI